MKKTKPIRILNIVPNMRAAGVETFIMNVYRNIDRSKIQFDFIVHNKKKEFYDDEIESLGGRIYRFSYKDDKNIIKYIKDLNSFFKEHKEYKIVHGHMQSMLPLYLHIAKKNGIKNRIAHSHNNSYEKSLKGFILHLLSRFTKYTSSINYACSNDAGKYMFGNKPYTVIYNGIDVDKFKYNYNSRKQIRKKLLKNEKDILVGNIGRMEKQKNQFFLLNVFKSVIEKNKNYKLIMIGEGSLEQKLKAYAKKIGIGEYVIFDKKISNINDYMNAMDIFSLPSLYEGLGIVLIEAQSSGLKCFATKDKVAKETNISNNIEYLPLDKNIWTDKILSISNNYKRSSIVSKEFDIKNVAKNLEKKYILMMEE